MFSPGVFNVNAVTLIAVTPRSPGLHISHSDGQLVSSIGFRCAVVSEVLHATVPRGVCCNGRGEARLRNTIPCIVLFPFLLTRDSHFPFVIPPPPLLSITELSAILSSSYSVASPISLAKNPPKTDPFTSCRCLSNT